MTDQQERLFPKIAHLDTRGKFFKVKDDLSINPKYRKLRMEIYQYDQKPNVCVSHSIDVDDFMYLAYLIRTGKLAVKPKTEEETAKLAAAGFVFGFSEYKGTEDRRGRYSTGYEARVLRIERQVARTGNGTVYVVTIDNGPGVPTEGGSGAIKMAPGTEGKKSLFFTIPEAEAIKLTFSIEQYVQAWMSTNFTAIQRAHSDWDKRPSEQPVAAPAASVPESASRF